MSKLNNKVPEIIENDDVPIWFSRIQHQHFHPHRYIELHDTLRVARCIMFNKDPWPANWLSYSRQVQPATLRAVCADKSAHDLEVRSDSIVLMEYYVEQIWESLTEDSWASNKLCSDMKFLKRIDSPEERSKYDPILCSSFDSHSRVLSLLLRCLSHDPWLRCRSLSANLGCKWNRMIIAIIYQVKLIKRWWERPLLS